MLYSIQKAIVHSRLSTLLIFKTIMWHFLQLSIGCRWKLITPCQAPTFLLFWASVTGSVLLAPFRISTLAPCSSQFFSLHSFLTFFLLHFSNAYCFFFIFPFFSGFFLLLHLFQIFLCPFPFLKIFLCTLLQVLTSSGVELDLFCSL